MNGSLATLVPAGDNSGPITSTSTWYHLAVDRDSSGNLRLHIDGAMAHKATGVAGALFNSTASLLIGARSGPSLYWNGHIDEVRVTKGVARYATDTSFSVPTALTRGHETNTAELTKY